MAQLETQNSKPKTNKARNWRRVLLRCLVVGLILFVVLSVVLIWAGRTLPRIAVAEISKLAGAKVDIKSVDFDFDGSVLIKQLAIRPDQEQQNDDAILKAETVYARFSLGSLLLLKPRLKEIRISNFVFNAQLDLDTGQWNVAALKAIGSKRGVGKRPFVRLEGGSLQYSKISKGQAEVVAAIPIDARFRPAQEIVGGYSFDITTGERAGSGKSRLFGFWRPGRITIAGGLSSAEGAAVERGFTINRLETELNYDQDNAYTLKLAIEDLQSTYSRAVDTFGLVRPVLSEKSGPFIALQRFFNRYRPAGEVNIDLEVSGKLGRLGASEVAGKVYCQDISICYQKFPYAVEHLTGQVDFTENSVVLNKLSGKHGDVDVTIDGWSKNFGPNRQYDIQVTSDNMVLDDDLYDALTAKQKKVWAAFSPSGLAEIDYRVSRQSQTDKKRAVVVDLLDGEATYRRFPYPLKNLTGRLVLDRQSAKVSQVVSRYDGRRIVLDGTITEYNTDRPIYDISIKAEDIPLDSTLAEALPDRHKNFYSKFDVTGLVDAQAKVFTPKQDSGPTSFLADVFFKKASLKLNESPLVVSDILGQAVFTPDSMSTTTLTGLYAEGLVSLAGDVRLGDESELSRYELTVGAERVQLSDELIGLLPRRLEETVSDWQPRGKVNLKADLKRTGSDKHPEYEIVVDCLGDSVNWKRFAYPLRDIAGRLTIRNNAVTLEDITATAGGDVAGATESSIIRVNGEMVFEDDAFSKGTFEISASDVVLDKRFEAALPESIAAVYKALSPSGRFDLDLTNIAIFNVDNERCVDFAGAAKFKGSGLNMFGARAELDGELETKGLYKLGYGLAGGRISVAGACIKVRGKSITGLTTDVNYDPGLQGWVSEKLVADCYGGKLAGKLEVKSAAGAAEEALAYMLRVGFDDVDLKRFVMGGRSGETVGSDYSSGTMSGSLSVGARVGEGAGRVGRCRLAIKDMRVGKLSPLAKLLYVLSLTEPKDFAFERMAVDSYIKGDRLFFETFDLSGKALAFRGSGWMDLESEDIDLTLTARGQRLAAAEISLLQSLAEGLGSAVVRMEVTGNAYDPHVETKTLPLIEDTLGILGTPR